MPKRSATSPPFLPRATCIAAASLACALAPGGVGAAGRSAPDVPVATIVAAYTRATHADDVKTMIVDGTLTGEGLSGSFHNVRDGVNEREDDVLGPRHETVLRLGDRVFVRNANGNVRELRGYLHRRALTEDYIASGAFAEHPETLRFAGWGDVDGERVWRLDVRAVGGETERLWIDPASGLPLKLEYLDGDASAFVVYGDWRNVSGRQVPFRVVQTDGDSHFDTVQQTTSIRIDERVDASAFAPLEAHGLFAGGVVTAPLIERAGHVGVMVRSAGHDWFFLLDTGAQGLLVDTAVLNGAGVLAEGRLEVRGATRSGGLGVAKLPHLSVGDATFDNVDVSVLDLHAATSGPLRFDGILGYPFFASGLVEMDFAKHIVRFGPPGSFVPQGERIDLDVDRELAEASLSVNGVTAPFIIDTGNSSEMLLYHPFVTAHPSLVPVSTSNSYNYGIGGSNHTYRTTVDVLTIGKTPLYHRYVDVILADSGAFADRVDAGNVGLGVLRNFVVTFDLGGGAMYVRPSVDFDDGRERNVFTR